jgi:hypothetical protein
MQYATFARTVWQSFPGHFTRPGHRRFAERGTTLPLSVEEHTITQSAATRGVRGQSLDGGLLDVGVFPDEQVGGFVNPGHFSRTNGHATPNQRPSRPVDPACRVFTSFEGAFLGPRHTVLPPGRRAGDA